MDLIRNKNYYDINQSREYKFVVEGIGKSITMYETWTIGEIEKRRSLKCAIEESWRLNGLIVLKIKISQENWSRKI